MDHDDRVKRVLALVADVTAFPAHYEPLPADERLIVALALGRVDWLKAEGVDCIFKLAIKSAEIGRGRYRRQVEDVAYLIEPSCASV